MSFGGSDPFSLPRHYRAVQAADGKVRVPGVPIFGENRRGHRAVFTRAWLARAVEKDRLLRSDGYAMPLHFGHHEPGVVREAAGSVELDRVGLRWYGGEPTWVLFGTLVFDDYERFEKARKRFKYRSVEISHEKSDEINSLALLDTEAPYFRFPVLAFSTPGPKVDNHFWSHELNMAEPTNSPNALQALTAGLPDAPTPAGVVSAIPANVQNDTQASASTAPKAAVKAEAGPAPAPASQPAPSGGDDVMARIQKLEALVAKLASAEPDGDEKGDDDGMTGARRQVPIVSASADISKLEGMFAAQSAKIEKLERDLSARDDREVQFASLKSELEPYGIPNLDVEIRTRIKDGSIQGWASGIKQFGKKIARHEEPVAANDPPEVAKYAAEPQALSEARRLAVLYRESSKRSLIRNHSLADFLASNIKVED